MCTRACSSGFIGLYQWPTFKWQPQIKTCQVVVRVVEEQGVELKQSWGLEEQEATNGPNVANIAAIIISLLVQEGARK